MALPWVFNPSLSPKNCMWILILYNISESSLQLYLHWKLTWRASFFRDNDDHSSTKWIRWITAAQNEFNGFFLRAPDSECECNRVLVHWCAFVKNVIFFLKVEMKLQKCVSEKDENFAKVKKNGEIRFCGTSIEGFWCNLWKQNRRCFQNW